MFEVNFSSVNKFQSLIKNPLRRTISSKKISILMLITDKKGFNFFDNEF
jgi:hypothetical protein